jgi:hypothetical protein
MGGMLGEPSKPEKASLAKRGGYHHARVEHCYLGNNYASGTGSSHTATTSNNRSSRCNDNNDNNFAIVFVPPPAPRKKAVKGPSHSQAHGKMCHKEKENHCSLQL